jgi:hypothetical protein
MLAYDKDKLNAWMFRTMAEDAADLGLISEKERSDILNRYPSPFFSPRTIVRIGLGFATMVAVLTFFSLFLLILGMDYSDFISYYLFGTAAIFILELMIRIKSHFRSGIDDLLLYLGFGILMVGMFTAFIDIPDPSLILSGILTFLSLLAALRYADRLLAGLVLIAFIMFCGFAVVKIDPGLWVYIPSVTLIISIASWFAMPILANKPRWIYYRHCFDFIQILGLVIAGACSNYYVIREIWYKLFYRSEISGSWETFYIATTILIPLATVISGFMQKDKKRIRIGTLMVAASAMTAHYYFISPPVEILCIIYGSLLLLISYWLLKHHKAKENGISFSEKHDSRDLFEIESLLIGAGVGMITPENTGGRFGGGSFGGAGSGASY